MKKIAIVVVLIASVVGAWAMVSSSETDAAPCIRCFPGGETPVAEGRDKTSCTGAINDAIAKATALIPSSCDVCGSTPIEVTPCQFVGGWDWVAEYKVRYKCKENLCL